jgi:hypothetical protein
MIKVCTGLDIKQDAISKTTRAKRAGGMSQIVECLPSKHKALSSNPAGVEDTYRDSEIVTANFPELKTVMSSETKNVRRVPRRTKF